MNILRQIRSIFTVSLFLVLLVMPGRALAETNIEGSNSTTGSNSDNEIENTVTNDISVHNSNNANINNSFNITASTGNNSASDNTGDGTVDTGDIDGEVEVISEGNTNSVGDGIGNAVALGSTDININSSNSHTGSGSNNNVTNNTDNQLNITSTNRADVDNRLTADLNTGGNKADDNTGDGTVRTGSIRFNVEVNNCLNQNAVNADLEDINCGIGGIPPITPINPVNPGGITRPPAPTVSPISPLLAAAIQPALAQPAVPQQGKVLAANILPATGANTNFKLLLTLALGFVISGLYVRSMAKSKLALVYTKPQYRLYNKNSV